ncbi:hypothetical protein [Microbacterium sp. GXF7504]
MIRRRTGTALTVAAASVLLLVGCGGAAEEAPTATPTADAVTSTPTPEPTVTPTEDADAVPTCETLILPEVVESFTEQGWTAEADTFRIGATEVPEGLWCVWGDYSVASDHVQIYGWAPVDPEVARTARADLLASGWRMVDDPDHDRVTENPDTALDLDEDGYGMTYEFGDGWVIVSDTRQGLLLIERPDA